MENLEERVRREAPDGFTAELTIARNMRTVARLHGRQEMAILCDELEDAAKADDAERCAKARKMLLDQAQRTIKNLPVSNPVTAPLAIAFGAGMKHGERLSERFFSFLDKRRKKAPPKA